MESVSEFCLNEDERLKYEAHQKAYCRYIAKLWNTATLLRKDSLADAFKLIAEGHTVDEACRLIRKSKNKIK